MATRYWVGGTGTWDASSTTNWSTASGGASGASAPVAADTVIFDSASGTGTCTIASGATCTTITLNSATLSLTLGANLTISGTFTLTLGALSLGTNTLSCSIFSSSNSNTRSIAFSTGNITVTGNNATIITFATATGFTYTGTPTFNCTYSGSVGTRTIFGATSATGGTESNSISINITAGTDIFTLGTGRLYKSINFTGFAGTYTNSTKNIYGNFVFSSGMTCGAGTAATTFSATSGIQQITTNGNTTIDFPITQDGVGGTVQLQDNLTMGSTRTYTLTAGTLALNNLVLSTGLFVSSNANTRSVAFGTGNITLTGNNATVLSMGTLTGFTYTGTPLIQLTYSGATGTRSMNVGSTGGTETNALSVSVTAGTDTLLITNGSNFRNFILTGFAGTLSNNSRTIYGNYNVPSGMTLTAGTSATTFASTSGTQQITINSQTLDFPLTFNGIGGTFAFQDALTQGSTRAFTITNGTVKLKAGATSTVGSFVTSGTNQKYLQSTTAGSQATLSQASGTVGVSYLTIQDIYATGGATWNAFYADSNVDAGNNTNWNFGGTPSYDAEYGYKLRSFTEHGRF